MEQRLQTLCFKNSSLIHLASPKGQTPSNWIRAILARAEASWRGVAPPIGTAIGMRRFQVYGMRRFQVCGMPWLCHRAAASCSALSLARKNRLSLTRRRPLRNVFTLLRLFERRFLAASANRKKSARAAVYTVSACCKPGHDAIAAGDFA